MATGRHLVLAYEYVPDVLERRGPHREAHLARIDEGVRDGSITIAGATGDPPDGALIVFSDVGEDAVRAWADADPYVTAGLVSALRVIPWTVVASA
jgi:uncharacterized protein